LMMSSSLLQLAMNSRLNRMNHRLFLYMLV
jgi:hypothetical protein